MNPNEGDDRVNYSPQADTGGLGASRYSAVNAKQQIKNVQWKASEFIDHQKSKAWFSVFVLVAIVAAIAVYVITRDILATVVILIAALAFGMYAGKKPRTLTYTLGPTNFTVGEKTYRYDDFKTFGLVQEGGLYSIVLEPVKRFMPPLTIYFAQEDGEKIFDAFAQHLPHEERKIDMVDSLMRKIRF